jgi:2,3-bisphosphoglycerate-dependent phosphoglycerate mutase
MDKSDPNHPSNYPIYKKISKDLIPDTESLKDTFKRVIPYYEKNILPILKKEKNVIISAHGNSLRSLCKKIFNITDGSIIELEIPTGNPIHITLKSDMSVSKYLYLDQKRAKKILINQ